MKKETKSLGYWALVLFLLLVIHGRTTYTPEHLSAFGSGIIFVVTIIFFYKLLVVSWKWFQATVRQVREETDIRNQDR